MWIKCLTHRILFDNGLNTIPKLNYKTDETEFTH